MGQCTPPLCALEGVSRRPYIFTKCSLPAALGEDIWAAGHALQPRQRSLPSVPCRKPRRYDPVYSGFQGFADYAQRLVVVLPAPGKLPARPAYGPGPIADKGNLQVRVPQSFSIHLLFLIKKQIPLLKNHVIKLFHRKEERQSAHWWHIVFNPVSFRLNVYKVSWSGPPWLTRLACMFISALGRGTPVASSQILADDSTTVIPTI